MKKDIINPDTSMTDSAAERPKVLMLGTRHRVCLGCGEVEEWCCCTISASTFAPSAPVLSPSDQRDLDELVAYVEGRATAVESMSAAVARHTKARRGKVARKRARKRQKAARRKNR